MFADVKASGYCKMRHETEQPEQILNTMNEVNDTERPKDDSPFFLFCTKDMDRYRTCSDKILDPSCAKNILSFKSLPSEMRR